MWRPARGLSSVSTSRYHRRVRDAVDEILEQWRRERPDLDLAPMALIGRLGRVARLLERQVETELGEHGLGLGEFDVLAALRRAGPPHRLTPTHLFRTLMLSSGAMTNRLDRLEKAGLVARHDDPDDRRGVLVGLTAKGLRAVDAAVTDHVANEARLVAGLARKEREQLDALLAKLLASLVASTETRPARRRGR